METSNPVDQPVNPLLTDLVVPGLLVRLPSRGKPYTRGELRGDVKNGEVTVYPMTLEDDIEFKSVDSVFSGDALRRVILRRVPQILQPGRLTAKDVDYLIVQLRKVSYGDTLSMDYTHMCEGAKKHTYEFSLDKEILLRAVELPSDLDLKVTMESGQVVEFQHVRFDDIILLLQANNSQLSSDQRRARELSGIMSVIRSITTTSGTVIVDTGMIEDWLAKIPRLWLQKLIDHIGQISNWGVDTSAEITCADCREKVRLSVPINPINFFT